jgi:hypothetical protein
MGLYDNLLAQAREKEAMAAINVPTSQATQYGAARGMARAKQGARQMFGIEEPAVIQAKALEARQAKLNGIVSKYSTASTRADFTSAFSELMANGFPEEAAKIQEHLKNMPKPKEFSVIEGYEKAKAEGYDKGFMQYQLDLKSAGKDSNVQFGSIPAGYELFQNPQGGYEMRVVKGGPADQEIQDLKDKEIREKIRKQMKGSLVIKNINLVREKILNPETIFGMEVGVTSWGSLLKDVPGTPAKAVSAMLNTIKANIGFAELNDMRAASPTGGALGQVSERELMFLQSVIGSLDQSQSKEDVMRVLGDIEYWYNYIIHEGNVGDHPYFTSSNIEDVDPAEVG